MEKTFQAAWKVEDRGRNVIACLKIHGEQFEEAGGFIHYDITCYRFIYKTYTLMRSVRFG